MNNEQKLKRVVMRRIYGIWLFRVVGRSLWLKLMLLVWLGWQIRVHVSPLAVWRNVEIAGGLANYSFFINALARTETVVQLYLLAAGLIGLWLFKNFLARLVRLPSRLGFFSRARL